MTSIYVLSFFLYFLLVGGLLVYDSNCTVCFILLFYIGGISVTFSRTNFAICKFIFSVGGLQFDVVDGARILRSLWL